MKRLAWSWLALVFALALCACDSESDGDENGFDGGATTDAADVESNGATDARDSSSDSNGQDVCDPPTCEERGVECGRYDSGCGYMVECGDCGDTGVCDDGVCVDDDENLASSVSQYGITWEFDDEYEVGQFANGDWWVVGPVTVESVTPAPEDGRNGSMLDPVGAQAYDSRAGRYDENKGVSFPLSIEPDSSLVSSISHPDEPECEQGGSDGWQTYNGSCQRGPIETQAVLTVLSDKPPASALRPPYAGSDKPIHRTSEICFDGLPKLSAPSELPDEDELLRHVERPWIDHLNSWTMQHGCATHNMFCYGREVGDIVSTLAAFATVETPSQEEVATRLVQLGIDNFGVLEAGGGWGADGGHFNGRKFPIVFAGVLLGDQKMASPGSDVGNEDQMTYYNDEGKALWGRDCNDCYFEAGCAYEDGCDGGSKDCRDPDEQVDGCSDYRNCCTSRTWVGEALAVHLMGAKDAWDHEAFFDYVDRWMEGDVDGGREASNGFVEAMWDEYRDADPVDERCE